MPGWSLFKTLGCTVDACTADGDSETPFSEPIPARGHASLGPAADMNYLEEEAALTRARANTTAGPTVMVSTEEVTTDFRGHVVLTMDLDAKIRAELEPEPEIETKEQRKKRIVRESTLATVVQDGDSLFDAPAALKADKEVVLAAVTQVRSARHSYCGQRSCAGCHID